MENDKQKRFRNFAFIVYPESAPENWRAILADHKIPIFISPLHDRDVDPLNQPKKPHFHVLVMFDTQKADYQVREVVDSVSGVGCEIVKSIRGYARYLCHMDNPEKAQYDPSDVVAFGGADFFDVISLVSDRYHIIREMIDYCVQYNVTEYCDLLVYASEEKDSWFRVLCDNGTVVMREFLRSVNFKMKSN